MGSTKQLPRLRRPGPAACLALVGLLLPTTAQSETRSANLEIAAEVRPACLVSSQLADGAGLRQNHRDLLRQFTQDGNGILGKVVVNCWGTASPIVAVIGGRGSTVLLPLAEVVIGTVEEQSLCSSNEPVQPAQSATCALGRGPDGSGAARLVQVSVAW